MGRSETKDLVRLGWLLTELVGHRCNGIFGFLEDINNTPLVDPGVVRLDSNDCWQCGSRGRSSSADRGDGSESNASGNSERFEEHHLVRKRIGEQESRTKARDRKRAASGSLTRN